jgi:hypothetical protein
MTQILEHETRGGKLYQASCTECSWIGQGRTVRESAQNDAEGHEAVWHA